MGRPNICMIGKYPPHTGGSASINYWLARTLGEMGHKIHIVTNHAEEGENYLENLDKEQMRGYEPRNVKVHAPEYEKDLLVKSRISTLVNLVVDVIGENSIDLIDTKYFIPYGVAGFFSKLITGKPLVTRHGGSDITYLLRSPLYSKLLTEMLKKSDRIILDPIKLEDMLNLGIPRDKIECLSDFGMSIKDDASRAKIRAFLKKIGACDKVPIIGCFGKISKNKGMIELLRALSKIKDNDFLLLMAPESGRDSIQHYLCKFGLQKKTKILDYQPPWAMPLLYNSITALIATEVDFPVKMHTPLTAYEAFYFGKCVVISQETHRKPSFATLKDNIDVIVVEPRDTAAYAKRLEWIVKNPEKANEIGRRVKSNSKNVDGKIFAQKLSEVYKKVAMC
jgi:glycosyltransferase involved in cell wall biosynthesis